MGVPFDRWDAYSAARWFTELHRRLEELLGPMGARALLARALNDAGRRWPQLDASLLREDGLQVDSLYRAFPAASGDGCSEAAASALQALVDGLTLLLTTFLGDELAAELIPPAEFSALHQHHSPNLPDGD